MFKLNNVSGLETFVTLTYPTLIAPASTEDLKRHRSKLIRALTKRKISGLIVAENHESRSLHHYHLAIDTRMTKDDMFEIWCRASEQNCNDIFFMLRGVRSTPIYDTETLAAYMSKEKQKEAPLPVRTWAAFGKYRGKVEPIQTIEGTAKELAEPIRLLKKLAQSERRKQSRKYGGRQRRFKDSGKRGFSLYGDGARAFQAFMSTTVKRL